MINLNINWNISEEVKNKIKFIEAISNSKWNINIKWDIKPEFLDSMLIQLVLLDKAKEDSIEFKWVWEKLGFKKNKDTKYTFMDLKGKQWSNGKDWVSWKDWKDWVSWLDGFNWKDWVNWISWTDWKDWENGQDWKDWVSWDSLEYDIRWNEIGIRIKGKGEFQYIRVTWERWIRWMSWLNWAWIIQEVEIDVGSLPVLQSIIPINDSGVTTNSHIVWGVAYKKPTGKDLDELDMDSISLKFEAKAGEINIHIKGLEGTIADKFIIWYSYT